MLRRTPVALWWLVGLLVLGVAVVPLLGADADADLAQLQAERAQRWVGTTSVVEGTFVELRDVRTVEPRIYRADAVYDVARADGSTTEVLVAQRREHRWPRAAEQPPRLALRVRLPLGGSRYAVESGDRLPPAQEAVVLTEREARRVSARADDLRLGTLVVAAVVLAACVAATVLAAGRPGRRSGWFAGTRTPDDDRDPAALDRAAGSAELPVAMALLAGLVVVVPLGARPVSLLVLAGLVALGVCSLLAREHEALGRAGGSRRRLATLLRAAGAPVAVAGLALLVAGTGDQRAQGGALAVLGVLTLLTARWQWRGVERRGGTPA